MKHQEVINLYTDIKNISNYEGATFAYAINKNIILLEAEIKVLEKQEIEIRDILKEYHQKRMAIQVASSKKNPDGSPLIVKNIYQFENEEAEKKVSEEIANLNLEWKPKLEEHDKRFKDYIKFLDETDSPYKPYMITRKILPKKITIEDMKKIFLLIED